MFKQSYFSFIRYSFLLIILTLAACGNDEKIACPTIDGEQHIAVAMTSLDQLPIMLHEQGKACPTVGDNTFKIYIGQLVNTETMAPHFMPQHADHVTNDTDIWHQEEHLKGMLTIESVEIYMPAHGHGTTTAPTIESAETFTVFFQMPGTWQITLELASQEMLPSGTQTVTFMVDVE